MIKPLSFMTTPEPPPIEIKSSSLFLSPTCSCTIVFVAISAIETTFEESTLGTTSSFSLIVSVIVTGSGRIISSSSKMPKKNKKDNTIMLVKKEDRKTKLKEDPLFFVL